MKDIMMFVFVLVLAIALVVSAWITKSHFEAKTYQRLTGKQVTTWDAMWVELRVQESAK